MMSTLLFSSWPVWSSRETWVFRLNQGDRGRLASRANSPWRILDQPNQGWKFQLNQGRERVEFQSNREWVVFRLNLARGILLPDQGMALTIRGNQGKRGCCHFHH